jgi:hypothetical protein
VKPLADAVRSVACTRESHAAAKADPATWQTWRLLGRQGDLELRDCPHCGSTLGKAVSP